MSTHRKVNRLSEVTGKLAASATHRRKLVTQGLLSTGGRVKADPVDNAKPPASSVAFVRALLGR